ncbi:hypothetical protein [Mycobacterium sp. OAE908]|uniref:hypothetical protein n=1 Tax=Mycobacterium sp. OAE908 TaxID=2817899 RepID=UPI001AE5DBB1
MRIRHAFTGYVYEDMGNGLVKVTDPATGNDGMFDTEGTWQSGELTYADCHMCRAVGGPKGADLSMLGSSPPTQDSAHREADVTS